MTPRLPLTLTIVFALTACAAEPATYTLTTRNPAVGRTEAERQLLEADLFRHDTSPRDRPIKLVSAKVPDYPLATRQQSAAGAVIVRLLVAENGSVTQVEVVKSPHPLLSEAVASAVSQWRFQPITVKGAPVQRWLTLEYYYNLEN